MARKIVIILLVFYGQFKTLFAYDIFTALEHRRDALDFETTSNLYYRSKFYLLFDNESGAGTTFIYLPQKKQKQFTANINLKLKDSFALQLGHYYIQFGSGLLIGKMQPYVADSFSFRSKILKNSPFNPCKSGNPAFAFTGSAFTFKLDFFKEIKLYLHTFFSYNRRYLKFDDTENKFTSASIASLQLHHLKDSPYDSAVYITTRGGMGSLHLNRYLSAHFYGFDNSLKSADNQTIDWDYHETNEESLAIKKISGYAAFLFYTDKFLQIFFENALSVKELNFNKKDRTFTDKEYGWARQGGFFFKHPRLKISTIYKKRDPGYYAPYENSFFNTTTGEAFYLKFFIFPCKWFYFNSDFSAQRKISGASSSDDSTIYIKEKYSLTTAPKTSFPLTFSYKRYARGQKEEQKSQYESKIKIIPFKKNYLALTAAYQKNEETGPSKILNSRFKIYFYKFNQISIQYLYALIENKNPVYISLNTIPGTNFPGRQLYKNASIASFAYSLNYNKKILALLYNCQFNREEIISWKINSLASLIF